MLLQFLNISGHLLLSQILIRSVSLSRALLIPPWKQKWSLVVHKQGVQISYTELGRTKRGRSATASLELRKLLLEDGIGWLLRKRIGLVAAWDFTTWVCSLSLSLPPM